MAAPNPLATLELRRRLLVAESELNRLELRQDLRALRHETRWLAELRSRAGGTGGAPSWMTVAAPVAGLFAAGSLLKRGTFLGRVSGLLKLAAVAYPAVRAWQKHRHSTEPPRV